MFNLISLTLVCLGVCMFEDRLIKLRKSKKLTQEQMSEKIGIHRATYANYERGY
ncbi:helix-turn-helix transcriptional regulator [Bacillus sp. FJAT-53060]|uniref:helix-turn-helix domain-containing protein n=1 Tax=Bacillus TaxID=1386 RepID=UPI0028ABA418|nr:helix-turn-helix transcriptional regulator [Bacillus stratosphericus]